VILRCLVRATAHLGVGMNMEQQRRNLLQWHFIHNEDIKYQGQNQRFYGVKPAPIISAMICPNSLQYQD
jgi:hypothetical protein